MIKDSSQSWLIKVLMAILISVLTLATGCTLPWSMSTSISTGSFSYLVRVQAEDSHEPPENGAEVTIELTDGKAPLVVETDSQGIARIIIPADYVGKPGRLIIKAKGYENYSLYIDLFKDVLPTSVSLKPVNINLGGGFIPEPTEEPTPTPIMGFTPAIVEKSTPIPVLTEETTSVIVEESTPTSVLTEEATSEISLATPIPPVNPSIIPTSQISGIFEGFESGCMWKRGDQPYGEFDCSTKQVYSDSYAGRLKYNFPPVENNFVVFKKTCQLSGQPNAISAWVYGDSSGHYLNVWVKDAEGEVWQMPFGRIQHTGWQTMTAEIKVSTEWPYDHISGSSNGRIDYPISFNALVLDGIPDNTESESEIFIDNLSSEKYDLSTLPPPVSPTSSPAPSIPQPEMEVSGRIAFPMDDGADHYDIWIKSLPTGTPFRAVQGARQPNFNKGDGRLVVNGESSPYGWNIILLNADLKPLDLISDFIEDEHPFWEPNGNRLVYANPIMMSAGTHLFVQCSASKRPQSEESDKCCDLKSYGVLMSSRGGDVFGEYPVWTDQDWIVFRGLGGVARPGLNGIVSWATPRDLPPYEEQIPVFIPNTSPNSRPTDATGGRVFFFADDIEGNWEVYSIELDGSDRINLSNSPGSRDGLPTVSPDGAWVAFVSDREGRWGVWVTRATGGTLPQKLFDFPNPNPWRIGSRNDWTTERISWGP